MSQAQAGELSTGSIPLTEPPFPRSEYAARWRSVVARFDEFEIDAIVVTAPTHVRYLTGYDGAGGYFAPFPLVVGRSGEPAMVCRLYDADGVRTQGVVEDVATYFGHPDLHRAWAGALHAAGLQRSRVGFELGISGMTPADVGELRRLLPDLQVVDASRLVSTVWAVKSAAELELMRQAMSLAKVAIETFRSGLREGVTESELGLQIDQAVVRAGGDCKQFFTLLFGRRTALPHGVPGDLPLRSGDVAFTELAGWRHGYAAALVRTAVLGSNPAAEALMAVAEEAQQAALEAARPGRTTGDVDAACRGVVQRAGRGACFRHRTGYGIGIGWYERGNVSLEPDGEDVLQPGMTFHMPTILFEKGEFSVGCSETIVLTEDGAEVMSGVPRSLFRTAPGPSSGP